MTVMYIHIGTYKTGSSTIQEALRNTASASESEGWKFVSVGRLGRTIRNADGYDPQVVETYRRKTREAIADAVPAGKALRVVMSNEHFSGSSDVGLANAQHAAAMLRGITEGHDVRIIVYLRRQDEWLESMYVQKIKNGESLEFDAFRSGLPDNALDYAGILGCYESEFGSENMVVRSYREASRHGIVRDFGEVIGSRSLMETDQARRKNPGLSGTALDIARQVNPSLREDQRKLLRLALQEVLPKAADRSFGLFSDPGRREYMDRFAASNQQVADRYFDGDVGTTFGAVEDQPPADDVAGLSTDEAAGLVANLLARMEEAPPSATGRGKMARSLFERARERLKGLSNRA